MIPSRPIKRTSVFSINRHGTSFLLHLQLSTAVMRVSVPLSSRLLKSCLFSYFFSQFIADCSFVGNEYFTRGDSVDASTGGDMEILAIREGGFSESFFPVRDNGGREFFFSTTLCSKADGKGWHCKNEAKGGHALCEHHLARLRCYNNNNNNILSRRSIKAKKVAGTRRQGQRAGRNGAAAWNDHCEFYYYSGFGPWWGKRRGARVANSGNDNNGHECAENNFGESDEDDEEKMEWQKPRKGRKPVKARSLKSLM